MTYKELWERFGTTPFIWRQQHLHIRVTLLGNNELYWEEPNYEGILLDEFDEDWNGELVDWFGEATLPTCTCDFYKVILVTGCKCGGK